VGQKWQDVLWSESSLHCNMEISAKVFAKNCAFVCCVYDTAIPRIKWLYLQYSQLQTAFISFLKEFYCFHGWVSTFLIEHSHFVLCATQNFLSANKFLLISFMVPQSSMVHQQHISALYLPCTDLCQDLSCKYRLPQKDVSICRLNSVRCNLKPSIWVVEIGVAGQDDVYSCT